MKCKDCELEKCVHTFNANNVDKCKRIREVKLTIHKNKRKGWEREIYKFINKMEKDYDRRVNAEFQYDSLYGYSYLSEVKLNIF